jgi:hypothetical protein
LAALASRRCAGKSRQEKVGENAERRNKEERTNPTPRELAPREAESCVPVGCEA